MRRFPRLLERRNHDMKHWIKNRFTRMMFPLALVMLMTGIFYLFYRVVPAFSNRYTPWNATQEGEQEISVPTSAGDMLLQDSADPNAPWQGSGAGSVPEPSSLGSTSTGPPPVESSSYEPAPTDTPSSDAVSEDTSSPETGQTLDPDRPMVALTFDDGPGQGTTAILDLLEQYHVRATFFVVGLCLEQPRQVEKMQRAYEMGNVIGSHTYDHKSFRTLTEEEIRDQIERADEAICAALGVSASLVRPPYGHVTEDARNAATTPFIHWSLDTEDWLSRDASSVIAAVQENVRDGDIILMHDTYSSTAEACETLIPWLIDQGYQLVTVPEMMEARGITMENGKMYKNAR